MPASLDPMNLETAAERQALALCDDTPPEVLSRLAADGNLHVRRAAAKHADLPRGTRRLLERAGATVDLTGFRVSDASMSEQEIETLMGLGEWGGWLAARHADTSADQLRRLAAKGGVAVRRWVAEHPSCPADLLAGFCGDVDPQTRVAAAGHPAVPRNMVAMLVAAGSRADLSGYGSERPTASMDFAALTAAGVYGRQLAARHPGVEPSRLAQLAEDADWRVRAAVAENPSADAALLSGLAGLDTFETRLRVAGHPQAPEATLLALSEEPDVRLRVAVAGNPGATSTLLRRLALDGSSAVREVVAEHPSFAESDRALIVTAGSSPDLQSFIEPTAEVSPRQLEEMAQHGAWGQRLAARHPFTPSGVLGQLITSGDPVLRDLARRHPSCPRALLEVLIAAGSADDLQGYERRDEVLSGEAIEVLLDGGPWARRLAARHRSVSADQLTRLAGDEDMQVRRAVAKNRSAPRETLGTMVYDVSHDVRWALVNRAELSSEATAVLLADPLPTIRLAAVMHPATSVEALGTVRFDLDEDVRTAVRERLG